MDQIFNIAKGFHSNWAYVVIILVVVALILSLVSLLNKKPLNALVRKVITFSMVSMHIQLLAGIVLMFTSPVVKEAMQLGMGDVMKNSALRMSIVEHPVLMLLAIIFMTIANAKTKRTESMSLSIVIFILLAIGSILSMLPYAQWLPV
jgi:hypothetical protein